MNYTGSMILFIFLVQLAAYTLKWLIGFGNPLISAPLLAMRLDNTLITPAVCCRIWSSTAGSPGKAGTISAGGPSFPCCWPWWPGCPRDLAAALLPALDHQNGFGRRCGISGTGNGHPPAAPRPPGPSGDPVAAVSGGLLLRYVRGAVRHQYVSGSLPSAHWPRITMNSRAAFASSFWVKTCSAPGCISAPGS